MLLENEELDNRRQALRESLTVLSRRERRIYEARRHRHDEARCILNYRAYPRRQTSGERRQAPDPSQQ